MNYDPGSDEAVAAGCLCPCMDNNYGEGMITAYGKKVFWINTDCPLHGGEVPSDQEISGN